MALGFQILSAQHRAPDALLDRFIGVAAAHLSDNMSRLSATGAALRPMHKGGGLVGNALTVRVRAGDNLMLHKAIDIASPRDVIVVDAGGELSQAIFGELMLRRAQQRGVAGLVIHGAIRDYATIHANTFPVYALGVTHRGPYKDGPGEINVAISVGGMVVNPGEVVVGDQDGLLAIPLPGIEQLIQRARAHLEAEAQTIQAMKDGRWDRAFIDALEARCTN